MEKDTNPKDAIGTAKWRQFMVVPRQVLWEVGVGMLEGALKYGRHNYRGAGVRASVYLDAAYGHLDQFCEGEDIDQDSGLSHVTKAICSLVVLRDAMMNDFWNDDRPPKIKDLEGVRARLQSKVAENFERYADKNPHHYTEAEDPAPYRTQEWYGVNMDPTEFAVMRRMIESGEWEARIKEQRSREALETVSKLKVPTVFHDGPEPDADTLYDGPNPSEHVIDTPDVQALFEAMFGSFPEGYVAKTSRVGDVEVTTFAPADHPWNAEGAAPALVQGKDLEIGKTYRVAMTHDGVPVDDGGVWDIVDFDDAGFPLGTKPTYFKGHPGTRLAASSWFVEVDDWNASDADMQDEDTLRVAEEAAILELMRREFAHAQASTEALAPIAGLTRRALRLLEDWRENEDGKKFAVNADPVSKAVALKQWAVSKGIIL